jgi:hypothetical protein
MIAASDVVLSIFASVALLGSGQVRQGGKWDPGCLTFEKLMVFMRNSRAWVCMIRDPSRRSGYWGLHYKGKQVDIQPEGEELADRAGASGHQRTDI